MYGWGLFSPCTCPLKKKSNVVSVSVGEQNACLFCLSWHRTPWIPICKTRARCVVLCCIRVLGLVRAYSLIFYRVNATDIWACKLPQFSCRHEIFTYIPLLLQSCDFTFRGATVHSSTLSGHILKEWALKIPLEWRSAQLWSVWSYNIWFQGFRTSANITLEPQ